MNLQKSYCFIHYEAYKPDQTTYSNECLCCHTGLFLPRPSIPAWFILSLAMIDVKGIIH